MSIRSRSRRLRFGMPTVAAVGAAALVVTAGVVLSGVSDTSTGSVNGELRGYESAPETAWTLDDQSLPGLTGDGDITVADTHGDDWLISYTAGIRTSYVLVDAADGALRWDAPVDTGFGACAFADDGEIGCSIRTRADGPDNGFFLVDPDTGEVVKQASGSDTGKLVGLDSDFVHVNDSGYQVSRRSPAGEVRWSRTFAAAATPKAEHGVLIVSTTDGRRFVLDPATGDDIAACRDCEVADYPTGLVLARDHDGTTSLDFYPVSDGAVAPRSATADGLTLVTGPSTLPVVTAGGDQVLADHGRYQVLDPATGHARWQVSDPELSKVHARPCGPLVSFARKDRSRAFFALADGTRLGDIASPKFGDPDSDVDMLSCVGASDSIAVFGNHNQLTAYRAADGERAWTLPISGDASDIDGRIVLLQGSELSVLSAD